MTYSFQRTFTVQSNPFSTRTIIHTKYASHSPSKQALSIGMTRSFALCWDSSLIGCASWLERISLLFDDLVIWREHDWVHSIHKCRSEMQDYVRICSDARKRWETQEQSFSLSNSIRSVVKSDSIKLLFLFEFFSVCSNSSYQNQSQISNLLRENSIQMISRG